MRVTCVRDGGGNAAPDIVEPILGESEAAARERGRVELDFASGLAEGRLERDYSPADLPGGLVMVMDESLGRAFPALITGVEISISRAGNGTEVKTSLGILKD